MTLKLGSALLGAVQDRPLEVGTGTGWRLPDAEFAADIVVTGPAPDDELLTVAPLLIVEVLSRSTRHIDLGHKRELYAAGGLAWYWVVDLVNDELVVFRDDSGSFAEVQRLTSGTTQDPIVIDVAVPDV